MSNAKYYIYFNLHKRCFSIRYKGKIVKHLRELTVYDGEFKVNQAGRLRVVAEKRKNVHAFIVADNYTAYGNTWWFREDPRRVTYNPYIFDSFVVEDEDRLLSPIKSSKQIICMVRNGKPVIMVQ